MREMVFSMNNFFFLIVLVKKQWEMLEHKLYSDEIWIYTKFGVCKVFNFFKKFTLLLEDELNWSKLTVKRFMFKKWFIFQVNAVLLN